MGRFDAQAHRDIRHGIGNYLSDHVQNVSWSEDAAAYRHLARRARQFDASYADLVRVMYEADFDQRDAARLIEELGNVYGRSEMLGAIALLWPE